MPRQASIDPAILEAALTGLESQKQRIDEQIASVRAMMGARTRPAAAPQKSTRRKRTISAEGKKRIAEAARKRWAAWRADRKKRSSE